jgi:hypothetical protein
MQRASVFLAVFLAAGGLCLFAPDAQAREAKGAAKDDAKETTKDDTKTSDEGDSDKDKSEKKDDAKSDEGDKKSDAEKSEKADIAPTEGGTPDANSPLEEKGKTYYFVGLRYRGIVVPQFIEGLFATGGRTVYVNGVGPEFAIRKDGFEYNLSPWLAFYNMDDTGFRGNSDPETAWELVKANITMLYLTSDFLWSHSFTPSFAVNYGLGAGLGFVFGSLYRTQSYPTVPGQNPDNYSKCVGPSNPPIVGPDGSQYCDNTGHFGSAEPSWANGGSKPILFPWLVVQTGVRYKFNRNIVARLDIGFGTSGFFFGLGGDYGL